MEERNVKPSIQRPFEILEQVSKVLNRLALPPVRSRVQDVFHISMLRENVKEPYHTPQHPEVEYTPAVREEIRLEKIMDARDMQLRDEMAHP